MKVISSCSCFLGATLTDSKSSQSLTPAPISSCLVSTLTRRIRRSSGYALHSLFGSKEETGRSTSDVAFPNHAVQGSLEGHMCNR
jgi:hypothetical protein